MKILLLSIIVFSIAVFSSSLAYAEQPLLDFYNNSQLVLVGKVISLSQVSTTTSNPSQSPNQTRYDIQVEQYYKHPQSAKMITVFGYAKGIYYGQDPTYNVGDRVFLYLDQENGYYQIQPHSFALDNGCDARSMIPIPTLSFESPPISTPSFGNIFDFQSASGIHSSTFGMGDKIRISFVAENYLPVIKYTTLNFTIKTDNDTTLVFNDTKQITIPACYSKIPISWDFIPKIPGTYFVSVNMSDSVSLGRQLVLFTEPSLGSSFDVRKNLTGVSLEKAPYQPYPLSPLKQVESGVAAKDVKCKEGLQLVIKSEDGSPACVSPENVTKLVKIGWARQDLYYHDIHVTPKITLNDYSYYGLENEHNVTVSIGNQTYYQTTLDYSAYNLPRTIPIKFHNVTFTFPDGTNSTPGGAFVTLDLKFSDGFEETYGKQTINPDGSGSGSGIPVPSQYGPHAAVNSTTVLSNHMKPQAGMTIYHDKIKLLVSTDTESPNISTQTSNSANALMLNLSTSSQMIKPRQAIGITVSVNNTLSKQVAVGDKNSWKINDLSTNPCVLEPYGIAIFSGFYSEQNMTEGKALPIFNNVALCPVYNKTSQAYLFQPSSGHVTLNNCTDTQSSCSSGYDMGRQLSFSGIWNNGENLQPFSPGLYTIVGGDEWGHVAIEHFVVSNSTIFAGELGTINCPAMTGGIQFSATIKNSTGFSNYYNSTQYGNTFFLHPGMKGVITVQYNSPANAAWFQSNQNTPFNMTNGAALLYMANVTEGKSTISYAASLYNDEMGHHSEICHYHMPFGGFEEPCDTDNTGDIPMGELPYASKVLHVGIDTSFEPNSVMFFPNTSPVFTTTVSANSDAMPGVYWLSLGRSLCDPGVLAKLVVLP